MMFIQLFKPNLELIVIFARRNIASRYKGSVLGGFWSAMNPILMISIYTLVFSNIFETRWSSGSSSQVDSPMSFAVNLFAGLIIFNMFAECATKSPLVIVQNPNFIKKVVFPIEILSVTIVIGSITDAIMGTTILGLIRTISGDIVSPNIIFTPIIWLPFIIKLLGLSWLLATIGVYVRDIIQMMSSFVSAMMFLSPIFYPVEALPEKLRFLAEINPLAGTIEMNRDLLINGSLPTFSAIISNMIISLIWCEICYRILKNRQHKFSDYI